MELSDQGIDGKLNSKSGLDLSVYIVETALPKPIEKAIDKSGLDVVAKDFVKAQVNLVNEAVGKAIEANLPQVPTPVPSGTPLPLVKPVPEPLPVFFQFPYGN
jgi:hypothetical protein